MPDVTFKVIPSNLLDPGTYVEIDGDRASGLVVTEKPAYLTGHYLSLGTGYVAGTPYRVTSPAEVADIAGRGSMLHRQAIAYFAQDKAGAVYVVPVAPLVAGVAATGTLTIVAAAGVTEDGAIHLGIGGQTVSVPVTTALATADAIKTAIITYLYPGGVVPDDLPVVVSTGGVAILTLTAKSKGSWGNEILVETNPGGSAAGQKFPGGVSVTITAAMGMAIEGSGASDYATALSTIDADEWGDLLIGESLDSVLDDAEAELNEVNGRWSYLEQLYGHAICARMGTVAQHTTYLSGRDSAHSTVICLEGAGSTGPAAYVPVVPNMPYEYAAAAAGAARVLWRADLSRGCTNLKLLPDATNNLRWRAPAAGSRFTPSERNQILGEHGSVVRYDGTGACYVHRLVTTSTSAAWRNRETPRRLEAIAEAYTSRLSTQFAGEAMTDRTISNVRAECIAVYADLVNLGVCTDEDAFAAALVAQQSGIDPDRLDVLLPVTLPGIAFVHAVRISFGF